MVKAAGWKPVKANKTSTRVVWYLNPSVAYGTSSFWSWISICSIPVLFRSIILISLLWSGCQRKYVVLVFVWVYPSDMFQGGREDKIPESPGSKVLQGMLPRLIAVLMQYHRQAKSLMKDHSIIHVKLLQVLEQQCICSQINNNYVQHSMTSSNRHSSSVPTVCTDVLALITLDFMPIPSLPSQHSRDKKSWHRPVNWLKVYSST